MSLDMSLLVCEHNMLKVLLENQATLHVLKNELLLFNISADKKASIRGIDGSQTGIPTFQVCGIAYVAVWFFNENADATA